MNIGPFLVTLIFVIHISFFCIAKRESLSLTKRSIKTQRIIKTKLPLQFCKTSLTIMIGKLEIVELTNTQQEQGKKGYKQTNQQTIIDIGLLIRFVYILSIQLLFGQLNKPYFSNQYNETVHTNWKDNMVLYVFIPLFSHLFYF